MSIKSLFKVFRSGSTNGESLTVVIQNGSVSIKEPNSDASDAVSFPIQSGDWQSVLEQALLATNSSANQVKVILNSDFYQTYQIEKPKLPREEWSVALPFLLKDLITERVTDIVADGIELPGGQKIQTYVVKKSLINDLVTLLQKSGYELQRLLPEDEVWAKIERETQSFMLLYRAKQENFKIAAFHETAIAFQRSIRTVAAPITNTASEALQLDGLALELQRSIDYLSSTVKQAHFGRLYVLCDEEEKERLASELQSRLSVQVSPLLENDASYAQVLASLELPESAGGINLYPDHLKPKTDYFTLTNLVAVWGSLAAILLGTHFFYDYQASGMSKQLTVLKADSRELSTKQATLQQKLARHVPTQAKVEAVERLNIEIQNKEISLGAVGKFDESQKLGFSGVMDSLAQLGRNDISLNKIYIDSNTLNMSGLASRPQAVPNWVNQFKKEHNLTGRTFETLSLGRNEEDIVTFELRAKVGK